MIVVKFVREDRIALGLIYGEGSSTQMALIGACRATYKVH